MTSCQFAQQYKSNNALGYRHIEQNWKETKSHTELLYYFDTFSLWDNLSQSETRHIIDPRQVTQTGC